MHGNGYMRGIPILLHEAKNVNWVLVFADVFLLKSIWYNVELVYIFKYVQFNNDHRYLFHLNQNS